MEAKRLSLSQADTVTFPDDMDAKSIGHLLDLELPVTVVLAEKEMSLETVLELGKDTVLSFEKLNNDPLELYVNDRLLGAGKVITSKHNFAIHITQIDSPEDTLKKLAES